MKKVTLALLLMVVALSMKAQEVKKSPEVSLVFGLNQPLVLNGFNFEVNYWTEKIVIDYSHGFGLELQDDLVSEEARDQKLGFQHHALLRLWSGVSFHEELQPQGGTEMAFLGGIL